MTFYLRDTFDIDASVGRELIFQLDVNREKSTDVCEQDVEIKFLIPGQGSPQTVMFKCSKENFGVKKIDLTTYANPAPEGRWLYQITKNADEKVSISVKITAKSKVTLLQTFKWMIKIF